MSCRMAEMSCPMMGIKLRAKRKIVQMVLTMYPNGVVSYETCPECGTEDVRVEHGHDEHGLPMHYWHCDGDGCENKGMVPYLGDCAKCEEEVRDAND